MKDGGRENRREIQKRKSKREMRKDGIRDEKRRKDGKWKIEEKE